MNSWTSPVDIRPDHLAIVQGILRVHLPAGFKVWVFGSRANWTTKDSSDLDLAVEGAVRLDHKSMIGLEVAFEESDLPYTVDVVDLKAVSSNFRQIVEDQRLSLPHHDQPGKDEWETASWGDLATLEYGKSLRGYESSEGPYRVYGTNGPIGWCNEPLCFHPSVIIGRKGAYRGVHYSATPFFVIDTAFYLRPKVEIDTRWAYYQLLTQDINGMDSGSAIPSTSREDFYGLPVKVPPLAEQRAIAHVLGTLDDKIELNRQMNRTLEEMARAIFHDWFVDFGPTRAKMEGLDSYLPAELWDLFPDELVDSELGEIPKEWETGVLSDTVKILSGGTPRTSVPEYWGGNVQWYTPKDAPNPSDIFVITTERSITLAGVDNSSTQMLPFGTTVISARGTVGRLACLGLPMAMNQTCYGIRGAIGYPDYFTYWNIRNTVEGLQARTHGTVFETITRDTFKIAESILAPTRVAQAYEEYIYPLMARILGNVFESFRLTGLRDALLPPLISGEVNPRKPEY